MKKNNTIQLIGLNSGNIFQLEIDGSGSLISSSDFGGNALASNSAGHIFTVSGLPGGVRPLVEIDPKTGAESIVTQFQNLSVRGLAFSSTDELFAISNTDLNSTTDELFKLNVNTGEQINIGTTVGFNGLQALDFSPEGTLYSWDISKGLVVIDPETAQTTDVNDAVGADVDIQSIVFTDDGRLFGGRDELYEIDVETGETTFIGEGGYDDLRGIEVLEVKNEIDGTGDRDVLIGKAGNDIINGGGGRDHIRGAGGNDILIGGNGLDRLTGNQGRDIFVLSLGQGRDIIRDFKNGVDSLGLSEGLSFSDLDIVGRGASTLIRYNNTKLASLSRVDAHTIGAEDFVPFH